MGWWCRGSGGLPSLRVPYYCLHHAHMVPNLASLGSFGFAVSILLWKHLLRHPSILFTVGLVQLKFCCFCSVSVDLCTFSSCLRGCWLRPWLPPHINQCVHGESAPTPPSFNKTLASSSILFTMGLAQLRICCFCSVCVYLCTFSTLLRRRIDQCPRRIGAYSSFFSRNARFVIHPVHHGTRKYSLYSICLDL